MNDKEFLKRLGLRIRDERLKRKMSARKLGYLADMDQASIYEIQAGRKDCRILTIRRLGVALEIDIGELLTL